MRIRSSKASNGAAGRPTNAGGAGRRPIGELLNIDTDSADAVTQRQSETGRLFGETAVELGMTDDVRVRRALEAQHGFVVLSAGDDRIDPLVVAAFDPEDPLARAARDLRGTITAAQRADGEPVRSLALIGLDAQVETAVTAANLAVACAQAGLRTLLIDAQLREPQQNMLFRLANRNGLSTVLSHGETVQQAAQGTAVDGLSVLTAGPAAPNASELFDRRNLATSVDTILDSYDLLVIDVADAASEGIAACAGLDAAILVLRRDVTSSRMVPKVAERLRREGLAVLGAIVVE